MITKQLKIINKLGLHARAAMKLSSLAERFQSSILIRYHHRDVDAKSIMDVMILAVSCGADIELIVNGIDEQEALLALENLIQDRFGEKE
jgi:phosphocarrier protein HPr